MSVVYMILMILGYVVCLVISSMLSKILLGALYRLPVIGDPLYKLCVKIPVIPLIYGMVMVPFGGVMIGACVYTVFKWFF